MSIRRLAVASALPALFVLATPASRAEACSAYPCWGGHFLPADGIVPSSLPAILWIPRSGDGSAVPDISGVALSRVTMGSELAVPVNVEPLGQTSFLVRPASPLEPGADYVVRGHDYCQPLGGMGPVVTEAVLHTSDAAELPATLGILSATGVTVGPLTVSTVAGSCSSSITAAQVHIEVEFSPDAAPWKDGLSFETHVDGELWHPAASLIASSPPGSSWQGRGTDLLFASCASDDPSADKGLTEGPHTVIMRATLPGAQTTVETQAVTIDLQCDPGSGQTNMPYPDDGVMGGCSAATGRPSATDWGVSAVAMLARMGYAEATPQDAVIVLIEARANVFGGHNALSFVPQCDSFHSRNGLVAGPAWMRLQRRRRLRGAAAGRGTGPEAAHRPRAAAPEEPPGRVGRQTAG